MKRGTYIQILMNVEIMNLLHSYKTFYSKKVSMQQVYAIYMYCYFFHKSTYQGLDMSHVKVKNILPLFLVIMCLSNTNLEIGKTIF